MAHATGEGVACSLPCRLQEVDAGQDEAMCAKLDQAINSEMDADMEGMLGAGLQEEEEEEDMEASDALVRAHVSG